MTLFSLKHLLEASETIYQKMAPTPQIQWPLLSETLGTELWVKHENHTPTGAFKIRGGITHIDWLKQSKPSCRGIVTATRGNHGQSQARAATALGIKAKIVVPHGNSVEKNKAMNAFGAELIIHGQDFDTAKVEAARLAEIEQLELVPAFHPQLVLGVSTYALELLKSISGLDIIYVPIGCGSGICGLIQARDLLGLNTKIVGVVSTEADAAKQSFERGQLITSQSAHTFADGMAVREPIPEAFEIYATGADKVISVSDEEIANAMRLYYTCTHNIAEGAGAASLAAALQERHTLRGKKIAVILSGANIDMTLYQEVLSGNCPSV